MEKSRKNKKSHGGVRDDDSGPELTKEEAKIAKFLRLSCQSKQGSLQGMKVNFFIASKLVDSLVDSQWGPGSSPTDKKKEAPFFASRSACVNFMQRLLNKQFFYRAVKIYKEQSSTTALTDESKDTPSSNTRKRKVAAAAAKQDGGEESESKATPKPSQTPGKSANESASATKRKFKLDMHEEQKFVDGTDPYVWVYDPTSTKTYVIGSLLILGAISICLFPLWPSQVREGVYYVSIVGASFLGAILSLAVIKYIVFAAVWLITLGSIRFWLFPNLTEDVGFIESFIPVYKLDSPANTSSSSAAAVKSSEQDETSTATSSNPVEAAQPESKTPAATPSGRKKSVNNVNNEDDGFELVNDDEIVKS